MKYVSISPALFASLLLVACGDDGGTADGDPDTTGATTGDETTGGTASPDDTGDTGADETATDETDDTAAGPACAEALGLFADETCDAVADGIVSFAPQYRLWSDGLVKDRYVYLPPGTTIDVSDPDAWSLPVGTVMWKHFATEAGVRLETRRIEKVADQDGPDGWEFETYVWNEAGDDVTAVEDGATNVLGTDHDIPSIMDCSNCHSGGANGMMGAPLDPEQYRDTPLGFSAIQLNHDGSDTTLTSLAADGWFDGTVSTTDAVMPGDATAQAALGYLHANCGHCHGGAEPAKNMTLWIEVGTPTVEASTTYQNTVDQMTDPAPMSMGLEELPAFRIVPGDPDNSAVPWRMRQRTDDDAPMPPLATEVVDEQGVAAVEAWIVALGA